MSFSKYYFLISVTVLLLVICSCTKGEADLKTKISPPDKSLFDLTSIRYDEPELLEIAKFAGSLKELDEQYPIDCLREDNGIYRASYLGNGKIAIILFDISENAFFGKVYSTELFKSDFDKLETGHSLNAARELDPNGEYFFLYTGKNTTPKMSFHYTKDGYLITIEYDVSNVIISMNQALI